MTADSDGYTNLWPQKAVKWHLKMVGLGENNPLGKCLPWSRSLMLTLILISICQQLFGIAIMLSEGGAIMAQIVIPIQFVVLIISAATEESYSLIYRRSVAVRCVKHSTKPLHCLLQADEVLIRRKHLPLFKFLMMCNVIDLYIAYIITAFVSPLCRFGFNLGSATFVLYPIWYPFDVLSSQSLFWAAFLYESMLFAVLVHTYGTKNTVFLYLFLMARIRFDALSQFVQGITPCHRHHALIGCKSKSGNNILMKESFPNRQGSTLKYLDTRSASGDIYSPTSNSIYESLGRLRNAIEDLHMLRRQIKLMNETFKAFVTICHLVGFSSTVIATFAMANEFRNSIGMQKNATDIFIFAVFDVASILQIYTLSYVTTLVQESYDILRESFWKIDWYAEEAEFKKLFIQTKAVLNQPLTIKAYSFYPINLVTFNSSLKESWAAILFLYKLTSPKQ